MKLKVMLIWLPDDVKGDHFYGLDFDDGATPAKLKSFLADYPIVIVECLTRAFRGGEVYRWSYAFAGNKGYASEISRVFGDRANKLESAPIVPQGARGFRLNDCPAERVHELLTQAGIDVDIKAPLIVA